MVNTEETDAIILVHHMVRPSETLDPTFPTIQLRLFLSICHPYFVLTHLQFVLCSA